MPNEKTKVAINGFGRIGRSFFKQAVEDDEVSIVAINDIGKIEDLVYLLRYDSAYGRYGHEVSHTEEDGKQYLVVGDTKYLMLNEKDPKELPWGDLDIDFVVESTGIFDEKEKAAMHIEAGAKRVVISANAKGEVPHSIVGASDFDKDALESKITSDGSCTTNAIVPVAGLLNQHIGVERGFMMTAHGYTSSQNLVDGPPQHHDIKRGRAAAQNIVLTSTSAAKAAPKALPFLEKGETFDAYAIRVPVITGSVMEFVFNTKRETNTEEINDVFKEAAQDEKWQKTLAVTEENLVSSDIIGEEYGAIVILPETRVLGGDLAKVLAWYDNEWGYSHTLLEHIKSIAPLV